MLRFVLLTVISGYLEMNEGVKVKESEVAQSCPTLCDPIDCSLPQTAAYRILRSWDFPGKSTRVGGHFLRQGIFPTQESNPGLPHCRNTLYPLSHQGSPRGHNSTHDRYLHGVHSKENDYYIKNKV